MKRFNQTLVKNFVITAKRNFPMLTPAVMIMILIAMMTMIIQNQLSERRYVTTKNKYMKGYNPNKESSYQMHSNVNDFHGQSMSQKLPVGGFQGRQ